MLTALQFECDLAPAGCSTRGSVCFHVSGGSFPTDPGVIKFLRASPTHCLRKRIPPAGDDG